MTRQVCASRTVARLTGHRYTAPQVIYSRVVSSVSVNARTPMTLAVVQGVAYLRGVGLKQASCDEDCSVRLILDSHNNERWRAGRMIP